MINLSGDKDQVIREAFRVLKPGGCFAVSDVVVRGEVPPEIRRNVELWVGCVAGALQDSEYTDKLANAGFVGIESNPHAFTTLRTHAPSCRTTVWMWMQSLRSSQINSWARLFMRQSLVLLHPWLLHLKKDRSDFVG